MKTKAGPRAYSILRYLAKPRQKLRTQVPQIYGRVKSSGKQSIWNTVSLSLALSQETAFD